MGPGLPALYDERLHRQTVPNLDSWFQAKTGHRYSYRTVCDMAVAFATGLNCSYRAQDVVRICTQACRQTIKHVFETEIAGEYRRNYWIEMLDPSKLPIQAQSIRENFDRLREKLGDEVFYNHLCRLWKVCSLQNPSEAAVFERLIARMGRTAIDPHYPEVPETDQLLCQRVVGGLLRSDIPPYQNVPVDIMRNVDDIQAGKL